jgi:hypothetical protein
VTRRIGDQLEQDELERVIAEQPPAPAATPAPATAEGTVTKAVLTERTAPTPGPTTAETAPETLGTKAARSEEAAMAAFTAVAQAARVETAIDHGVIHVPARPATPAPSAAIGMGKMHILSFKMLHDAL